MPMSGRIWSAKRGCPANEPMKLTSSNRLLTLLRVTTAIGFILLCACAAEAFNMALVIKAQVATTTKNKDLAAEGCRRREILTAQSPGKWGGRLNVG